MTRLIHLHSQASVTFGGVERRKTSNALMQSALVSYVLVTPRKPLDARDTIRHRGWYPASVVQFRSRLPSLRLQVARITFSDNPPAGLAHIFFVCHHD